MPEAHNLTLRRRRVHFTTQQAQLLPTCPSYGTKVPRLEPSPHPAKSSNPVVVMSALPDRKGRWRDSAEEHPDCQKTIRCLPATVSPLWQGSKKQTGKSQLSLLPGCASARRPGDDASRSQRPPSMRFGKHGRGWNRPGREAAGSQPSGRNGHPSRSAATHCCSAAPLPLPLQPTATQRPHPSARTRLGSAAIPPHPLPSVAGVAALPPQPLSKRGGCAPHAKTLVRALGRFQPNNTHCAPISPS